MRGTSVWAERRGEQDREEHEQERGRKCVCAPRANRVFFGLAEHEIDGGKTGCKTGKAHARYGCVLPREAEWARELARLDLLQYVCCSLMQCVFQCVAVRCNMLQCVAICCSVLQCVAVCCSVLQYVAVFYNVLQCATR